MSCRTCKSYPNCDGCNINTLIKALHEGRFDFDEHHNVIIPDKVIHAKWEYIIAGDNIVLGGICSNCKQESGRITKYCDKCGAKMDKG